MQLQNLKISPPVGQYDKTRILQAKTSLKQPKTTILDENLVGRQAPKNSHVHTHAGDKNIKISHKKAFVPDFAPINHSLNSAVDSLKHFINLFNSTEKNKVVFHSHDYVSSVTADYKTEKAIVFLDLVKVFALLHKEDRNEVLGGVIETKEEDFLFALRLFKATRIQTKQTPNFTPTAKVIWDEINTKYKNKAFSTQDLELELNYDASTLRYYLKELQKEEFIVYAGKYRGLQHYQLLGVEDPRFTTKNRKKLAQKHKEETRIKNNKKRKAERKLKDNHVFF